MKTSIQELIEHLTEQLDKVVKEHPIEVSYDTYWRGVKIGLETTIALAESFIEKEKEQMVDFAFKYGDLTTRQIADAFDKEYKTNEK
jgi:hypothetical protein